MRQLKTYLGLYLRSFRLFWLAAKGSSLILLILVPIQALAPAALLALGQQILDGLQQQTAIVALIVAWAVMFFVSNAAIPINTSIQGILTDKLIAFVNLQLMGKSKQIKGLTAFEDADFYDELQLLSSEASWRPVNLIVFGISMVREAIGTLAMFALIAHYNVLLAVVLLAAAIPQSLVSYHVQRDAFETMVDRSPDARKLQYYSEALLTARDAKEVRLFGAFDFFIDAYRTVYGKIHGQVRSVRLRQMWVALGTLIISLALSVVSLVWFVGQIQQGRISAGGFLVFVSALTSTASSIYALVENSSMMYDTLLYMQKYFKFMAYTEPDNETGTLPFPAQVNDVTFEHVNFQYHNQQVPALTDVNFTVHQGEKIAVVGENGAGKTTLIKLLTRFYTADQGRITINGTDVKAMDVTALRQHVGAVFQDFSKFLLPVGQSIGIGNPDHMNDATVVMAAAHTGGFDRVLTDKKLTLASQLGQQFAGGVDLSGGQWQKLAIARAFMADSQLLILDEPTAALDPRSEFEVYQSFIQLAKGRTVFFITHRLSAVQMADKVLVLQNGQVVGFDTHAALLANNAYYAELYHMQADSYQA